jgi:CTP synthase (UTP-ammonia lyase)
MMHRLRIGVIGDYSPDFHSHAATAKAILRAASHAGIACDVEWVPTPTLASNGCRPLEDFHGLWASPGSPYKSFAGMLAGINFARTRNWPFVGT